MIRFDKTLRFSLVMISGAATLALTSVLAVHYAHSVHMVLGAELLEFLIWPVVFYVAVPGIQHLPESLNMVVYVAFIILGNMYAFTAGAWACHKTLAGIERRTK